MITTTRLILLLAAAGMSALHAADSAQTLTQRHVDVIRTGDVDKLVADYADDAVALTPPGLFSSRPATEEGIAEDKAELKKLFELLCGPKYFTAVKGMDARIERVSDTVAVLHWTQFKGTPQQLSGIDVFVTKNGKIVTQWLGPGTPDAPKAPTKIAAPAPKK
jgi:ketosteroid isomerase-like protein